MISRRKGGDHEEDEKWYYIIAREWSIVGSWWFKPHWSIVDEIGVKIHDKISHKPLVFEETILYPMNACQFLLLLMNLIIYILLDLSNIGVKINEEDRAILLVYSLLPSYENFIDTLMNRKSTVSIEKVKSALNSKC